MIVSPKDFKAPNVSNVVLDFLVVRNVNSVLLSTMDILIAKVSGLTTKLMSNKVQQNSFLIKLWELRLTKGRQNEKNYFSFRVSHMMHQIPDEFC